MKRIAFLTEATAALRIQSCAVSTFSTGRNKFATVPSQPKLLQKLLQEYFLEAINFVINFVIITKRLCIQIEKTRKRPQKYYKNNCFRELFCNNFGQDGNH